MRDIAARSLLLGILLLAGCGGPQHTSAPAGAAPASPGALAIRDVHTTRGVVVATVAPPAGWQASDALERGDDLATLVDDLRAKHPHAALRIEVREDGKLVASADSPKRGRVTFSMKK